MVENDQKHLKMSKKVPFHHAHKRHTRGLLGDEYLNVLRVLTVPENEEKTGVISRYIKL